MSKGNQWYEKMVRTSEGREAVSNVVDAWTKFTEYLIVNIGDDDVQKTMLKAVFFAIKYFDSYKSQQRPAQNKFDYPPSLYSRQIMYVCEEDNDVFQYADWLIRVCMIPKHYLNGSAGEMELELIKSWIRGESIGMPGDDCSLLEKGIIGTPEQRMGSLILLLSLITKNEEELDREIDFVKSLPDGVNMKPIWERVGNLRGASSKFISKEDYNIPDAFNRYSFLGLEDLFLHLSKESVSRLFNRIAPALPDLGEDVYMIDFSDICNFFMRLGSSVTHIKLLVLNELLAGDSNEKVYFTFLKPYKMLKVSVSCCPQLDSKINEWGKKFYHESPERLRQEIKDFLA